MPGADGPTDRAERGWQPMSLPVRMASVTPVRSAMAVMAAQTSSDLTRVPEPPSIRMPVRALPVAALFSSTVPVLGTAEPPEAEARPPAGGRRRSSR